MRTASNVVNDFPHVRPSTRARVQSAIDELGYRPNLSARQLKYGRSGFLTLAIPQIDSPYFGELAQKFTEAAAEHGFIALMDVTRGALEQEKQVMSGVQSHMVDGVVFSPLSVKAADFGSRRDTTPMVLLGERAVPSGYDHVAIDSVAASRAMVQHLLDLGRRRIAVIGYEAFDGTASVRAQGHRDALAEAGIAVDTDLVVGVPAYTRAAGREAMEGLLALPEPPDAVFCFNDLMAIGALSACRARGIRVPEDVAVAGSDDIAEAAFADPPLTTIQPDLDALTHESLRLLLGRINGTLSEGAIEAHVPWRLVLRESTVGRG
ncbi:LacI family transcriptional regulator [Luteococcus japonicus]|uniref:LacI family transcriptional regulator n=1 Tax=Luteococcus japonicus TaxID=33984 RepID=A0A3N1ZWV4_9ACTN|nr:LacI family transcriptional regulator [Luteococcus japonicus]